MDYAEFEQGHYEEIEEIFLKRLHVVRYPELTDEMVDRLIIEFKDAYDEVVDHLAQAYGVFND